MSIQIDHFATEHFTEKEIEETLDSKEGNPNVYVLSSGRWSHNQGNCFWQIDCEAYESHFV